MGQYGKHGFHMFDHGQENKVHEVLTILRGQSVLPLCAFLFCGFCVKGSQASQPGTKYRESENYSW